MLLHAERIRFSYAGARPVLQDVSASLAPGKVTVLLGPNGSGKSTLLRILIGQLDGFEGQIEWDSRAIRDWRPRELARVVGYLPQSPSWEPGQTVLQVLRAGRTPYLRAFGIESPRDGQVVQETAQRLDLIDLLGRPVEELSGGQRQRVFIGRALAQEPRALLLDEPTTFLDLRHQAELAGLLRQLARQQNLAILAASHDLSLSAAFADELILLNQGEIAASGTADQVLRPELLGKVYGIEMERVDRPGRTPVVVPVI